LTPPTVSSITKEFNLCHESFRAAAANMAAVGIFFSLHGIDSAGYDSSRNDT
jgi:hypothetical protein